MSRARILVLALVLAFVSLGASAALVDDHEWSATRTSAPPHARPAESGRETEPLDPTLVSLDAQAQVDIGRVVAYLAAIEHERIERERAAQEQADRDAAARAVPGSAGGGSCNGDAACFLPCTRAHESDTSGGYSAVSPGGTYRGAYQFRQDTWDAAVSGAGHDEYAGTPPDQAPPEVQDAAATHLYSQSGNRPWGGRC